MLSCVRTQLIPQFKHADNQQHQKQATASAHPPQVIMRQEKTCPCEGDCPACEEDRLQAKLKVSQRHDKYEQEADLMADRFITNRLSSKGEHQSVSAAKPIQTIQRLEEEEQDEGEVQAKLTSMPIKEIIQRDETEEQQDDLEEKGEEQLVHGKHKTDGKKTVDPSTQQQINNLQGRGQPIPNQTRSEYESYFGYDFGHVRVHTGDQANTISNQLGARAWTLNNNIAFASGEYKPGTVQGDRLLAHELTHVVHQQSSTLRRKSIIQRDCRRSRPSGNWQNFTHSGRNQAYTDQAGASDHVRQFSGMRQYRQLEFSCYRVRANFYQIVSRPRSGGSSGGGQQQQQRVSCRNLRAGGRINGRPSKRNRDWPNTHITNIDIDLGNLGNGLRITWTNTPVGRALTRCPGHPLAFPFSPGAGKCCCDCNNTAISQRVGSLCTPKGAWRIHSTRRATLSGFPTARNPVYFSRSGVAIHQGNLPGSPASHGCSRTSSDGSKIIFDNVKYSGPVARRTLVNVHGTWTGTRCYRRSTDQRSVARTSACGRSRRCVVGRRVRP